MCNIIFCTTADADFNGATPLIQTFDSGSTAGDSVCFDIDVFEDSVVERDEQFFVELKDTDIVVHQKRAYIEILDDDSKQY